jgi:OmpA-OmpF porin, OOP family
LEIYMELIKTILAGVSPDNYRTLSSLLGESEDKVKSGIAAAVPTMLGSLLSKANASDAHSERSGGIDTIFKTVQDLSSQHGGLDLLLKNPSSFLGGSNAGIIDQLISLIFGEKKGQILQTLQGLSGLNIKSVTSLLGLAAPLIFGGLKKSVEAAGGQFTPKSVTSLLSSASPEITKMLPAGLGSILSLTGIARSVDSVSDAVSGASNYAKSSIPLPNKKSSWGITPYLLPLLALGMFWFYSMRPKDTTTVRPIADADSTRFSTASKSNQETASQVRLPSDAESVKASLGQDKEGIVENSASIEEQNTIKEVQNADTDRTVDVLRKMLPDGTNISFTSQSIENKLLEFIEDPAKAPDNQVWFNFDKLNFETASAKIMSTSQTQIANIATIMKAYPSLALKIGGYTDNTGNAAANQTLSSERAKATEAALINLGIAPSRLSSEGYGNQFPVASNDTPEGRALNRRIAVRVVTK